MNITPEIILPIHSATGAAVFIIGLLQIVLKKGGKRHIILGQVYLFLWFLLLVTGAYLGGPMITLIGLFGFYFAITGARISKLKNKSFQLFDKIIAISSVVVMVYIMYYGVNLYLGGDTSFGTIFLVFGLIFLLTLQKDIRKYLHIGPAIPLKYGKMDWYFEHLTRMSISFIAAVTAFTSIQNVFGQNTLNFLLPTVIGTAMIVFFTKRLSKKMVSGEGE